MSELTNIADLRAASEEARYEFLVADLALCGTLADLVKTERALGEREAAERILGKAEAGYAVISRFLRDVSDARQREEIERKLGELRGRLDRLKLGETGPGTTVE